MSTKFQRLGASIFIIADPEKRSSKLLELLQERGVPHERIPPTFLHEYPPEFNPKRSHVLSKKALTLPEIGCAKSHLECYRAFLESENNYAVIFEDDADLIDSDLDALSDLTGKFLKFAKTIPYEKPIALVYYTESANLIRLNEDFYQVIGNASHAMAYLINRNAAKKILERNTNIDYVADWPRGTAIKFFFPVRQLFEHGSKNGLVKSFIEPERFSSALDLKTKLAQNLRIVTFAHYFSNFKNFNGIREYLKILWLPLIQWQLFRAISRLIPNSQKIKSLKKKS
ncbi:Glycosyl transferase, family 25 [Candidatus Nanopelagicaceae bacterium]